VCEFTGQVQRSGSYHGYRSSCLSAASPARPAKAPIQRSVQKPHVCWWTTAHTARSSETRRSSLLPGQAAEEYVDCICACVSAPPHRRTLFTTMHSFMHTSFHTGLPSASGASRRPAALRPPRRLSSKPIYLLGRNAVPPRRTATRSCRVTKAPILPVWGAPSYIKLCSLASIHFTRILKSGSGKRALVAECGAIPVQTWVVGGG
jgi:hypothetical protein